MCLPGSSSRGGRRSSTAAGSRPGRIAGSAGYIASATSAEHVSDIPDANRSRPMQQQADRLSQLERPKPITSACVSDTGRAWRASAASTCAYRIRRRLPRPRNLAQDQPPKGRGNQSPLSTQTTAACASCPCRWTPLLGPSSPTIRTTDLPNPPRTRHSYSRRDRSPL